MQVHPRYIVPLRVGCRVLRLGISASIVQEIAGDLLWVAGQESLGSDWLPLDPVID